MKSNCLFQMIATGPRIFWILCLVTLFVFFGYISVSVHVERSFELIIKERMLEDEALFEKEWEDIERQIRIAKEPSKTLNRKKSKKKCPHGTHTY